MPRDADALKVRKWAGSEPTNRAEPSDAKRGTGYGATYSQAGGDTPERTELNQILSEATAIGVEYNTKGIPEWDGGIDYEQYASAQAGGRHYIASVATGPTGSNATDPTASGQTVWTLQSGTTAEPGKPDAPTLTVGNGQLEAGWPCPLDGGSVVTGFTVQWRVQGGSFSAAQQATVTVPLHTITGLANGTTYDVRVRATNSIGNGPWSDEASATPLGAVPDRDRLAAGAAA